MSRKLLLFGFEELPTILAAAAAAGPFGAGVVLCGLEDQVDCLLPALRQAGIGRDCLKAVLTPHNRTWTAVKLYQELLREHQAMNGR